MDVEAQKEEEPKGDELKGPAAPEEDKMLEEEHESAAGAPSTSAEDQLLQESIRSTAPGPPESQPDSAHTSSQPRAVTPQATANRVASSPGKTVEDPATGPAETLPSQPAPSIPTAEIPDSDEEPPDKMDVDLEENDTQAQEQPPSIEQASSNRPASPEPPGSKSPSENAAPAPDRAVTRVSSGALRLKSVNEIVGGSPRPSQLLSTPKGPQNQLTPVTSTSQSPTPRVRGTNHRRLPSKNHASTVVFAKQPKRNEEKSLVTGQRDAFQPVDDYFTPLFLQAFTGNSNGMMSIDKLLFQANKTVATTDANLALRDIQACKILRRIYQLQHQDKWSLRQPKRCPEPTRPSSHWDTLLHEVKWMRTDFREERKWKMAVAKNLAYACAEWHEASPEMRKDLQVAAVIPPHADASHHTPMADASQDGPDNHPTPDLVFSGDADSPQLVDELSEDFSETVAPSAIFTLQEDDVVFGLRRSPTSDQLLDELPMYGSPLKVPSFDIMGSSQDPDAHWRRPALPLSKYVEGDIELISDGPPRKRSRYSHQNEDSDDEPDYGVVASDSMQIKLPPATTEVALFNPESKTIRDRLHAGHQFRPPSEHPMPTQSFYECRNPSQWTMAEDDELRTLVRDYSYNWSLISSMLSTKSLFVSGAERRTPWECFERWINLEGLPADMQKTQYFKAYNNRIENAQRVIAQQNQLAAQQASANGSAAGGAGTPIRRRPSVPVRVEKRRCQKHLALIDGMRKLAKKRETIIQKQQHAASQTVNNKKPNDNVPRNAIKTPRDYSLLRWERDQALADKVAAFAQRQEAARRVSTISHTQASAMKNMSNPFNQSRWPPKAEHKVKGRR